MTYSPLTQLLLRQDGDGIVALLGSGFMLSVDDTIAQDDARAAFRILGGAVLVPETTIDSAADLLLRILDRIEDGPPFTRWGRAIGRGLVTAMRPLDGGSDRAADARAEVEQILRGFVRLGRVPKRRCYTYPISTLTIAEKLMLHGFFRSVDGLLPLLQLDHVARQKHDALGHLQLLNVVAGLFTLMHGNDQIGDEAVGVLNRTETRVGINAIFDAVVHEEEDMLRHFAMIRYIVSMLKVICRVDWPNDIEEQIAMWRDSGQEYLAMARHRLLMLASTDQETRIAARDAALELVGKPTITANDDLDGGVIPSEAELEGAARYSYARILAFETLVDWHEPDPRIGAMLALVLALPETIWWRFVIPIVERQGLSVVEAVEQMNRTIEHFPKHDRPGLDVDFLREITELAARQGRAEEIIPELERLRAKILL